MADTLSKGRKRRNPAAALGRRMQGVIPKPAYDYLRYWWKRYFNSGYYAFNDLDRKLERYLDFDNGFFIELGANDGYTQSNTLYFEEKRKWRGILIEPAPNLFLKCCYFPNKPGNSFFCNACVPFDFDEKYVEISYANLMSTSVNLDSDIVDPSKFQSLASTLSSVHERSIRFGAVARTLTSILDEAGAPKSIDLLSLDIEGAELSVLKGIDFDKYSFRYILVECWDHDKIRTFLARFGYQQIDQLSHHDFLFARVA